MSKRHCKVKKKVSNSFPTGDLFKSFNNKISSISGSGLCEYYRNPYGSRPTWLGWTILLLTPSLGPHPFQIYIGGVGPTPVLQG